LSLFTSSRSVLLLTDDGLHIYKVSSLSARYIDFIPWSMQDFVGVVSDILNKKCGAKPVVLLNDMVEQHYRKEKIPKASVMDKSTVIKRRLGIAFPNYPIRAALKMKEQKKDAAGTYLFAAIPQSDAYKKVIDSVRRSGVSIVGLYLLPIEGTTMVKALSLKKAKETKTRSQWTIFIGQHHGGGLRQIVTKQGDLALTRLTPVVDTDVEPDTWVKEVSSELQSTMSYLGRFGYKPEDGLDIFIIANDETQGLLENIIDIPSNLYCLNAQEAAGVLGVKLGRQEDLRYADALHAAWQGRQSRFVLPMQNKTLDSLTKPRRIANLVMLGLLGALAYFGFTGFQAWNGVAQTQDKVRTLKTQNIALKEEYKNHLAEKSVEGYDYLLVNNAIDVYSSAENKKARLFDIYKALGRHLGPNLKADNVTLETFEGKQEQDAFAYGYDAGASGEAAPILTKASITIIFPEIVDTDTAINKINQMVAGMSNDLPDYLVDIERQIGGVSYSESLVEEIADDKDSASVEARTAVIIVEQKMPEKEENAGAQ